MAKKKSSNKRLIVGLVVLALCVLTVCTLFMPVFSTTGKLLGKGVIEDIKGRDVISALFNDKGSSDLTNGANNLIKLKSSDDAGTITKAFILIYSLTVLISAISGVFSLLSLSGLKFKFFNTILGAALLVLAVVTFILSFQVADKFTVFNLFDLVSSKTAIAIGMYSMIATFICGGTEIYLSRC